MGEREYRLRDRALMSVQSGEELVALDMRRSVYLAANESGRQLWELLARGATERALTALLQERYKLDSRTAARDVSAFLEELQAAGLLVPDIDASGGS
jgi:hypothetical protein